MADKKPELISIRGSIAMLRGDTKLSLELLDRAIYELRDSGSDEELASSLIRRSEINRHFGNYDMALKDALDAIELSKPPFGSPSQFAEALRVEGLVYYQTGELNDAQWKMRESYRRFLDLEMESDAAKVLMELGTVYLAQGDYNQTERCYFDSLAYWQGLHNSILQANILNNIGVLQHNRGQYEQAAISFEKALAYSRLAVNPRLEGYTLTSLGDLYRDLRATKEARQAYTQASEILKKTNDVSLEVYLTLALAVLDRISGDYSASQKEVDIAIEKANKSGSKYETNTCLLEQYMLMIKKGSKTDLYSEILKLEEYFIAAGFQMEAFKAAVYRSLSRLSDSTDARLEPLENLAQMNSDGDKHRLLVQIGLENKTLLEKALKSADEHQTLIKLIHEVTEFERLLPQLHRVIRRYSSAVQFANPKLVVRAFGKMQVKLGNRTITGKEWKTQIVRDLFFFLLDHPDGVTKEDIGEVFWPDADRDTLRLRFKNTIYRMRRAVGKDSVTFIDDYYRFNRNIDYDYDVDSFLQEIELAKKTTEVDDQIEHYRAALNYYHGSLLPKVDHEWVLSAREKYHQQFMNASVNLINLYIKTNRYSNAVALSERALEEDNFNEVLHRSAMLAYSGMNDRSAIARQFERCRSALMKELQIEPSPQTVTLYNSLMHQ